MTAAVVFAFVFVFVGKKKWRPNRATLAGEVQKETTAKSSDGKQNTWNRCGRHFQSNNDDDDDNKKKTKDDRHAPSEENRQPKKKLQTKKKKQKTKRENEINNAQLPT